MSKKLFYLIFILFITLQLSTVSALKDEYADLKVGDVLEEPAYVNFVIPSEEKKYYIVLAYVDESNKLMSVVTTDLLVSGVSKELNINYIKNYNVVFDNENKVEEIFDVYSWEVLDKDDTEFCNNYAEIKTLNICNPEENEEYIFLVMKLHDNGPRFTFVCDTEKVVSGDNFSCTLSYEANYDDVLVVSFNLSNKNYDLISTALAEYWDIDSTLDEGEYNFRCERSDLESKQIAVFNFVAKNESEMDVKVELEDFLFGYLRVGYEGGTSSYAHNTYDMVHMSLPKNVIKDDEVVEGNSASVEEDDKEDEKNPNTSDMSVILILMSLIISGMICLKLSNKLLMK